MAGQPLYMERDKAHIPEIGTVLANYTTQIPSVEC